MLGSTGIRSRSWSLRDGANTRWHAYRPVIRQTLRRARLFTWLGQWSEATSDREWEKILCKMENFVVVVAPGLSSSSRASSSSTSFPQDSWSSSSPAILRSDDTHDQAPGNRRDNPKTQKHKSTDPSVVWEHLHCYFFARSGWWRRRARALNRRRQCARPEPGRSNDGQPRAEETVELLSHAIGGLGGSGVSQEKLKTTNKQRETACETSRSGKRSSQKIGRNRSANSQTFLMTQIRNVLWKWHHGSITEIAKSACERKWQVLLAEDALAKLHLEHRSLVTWWLQILKSSMKDVNLETITDNQSWHKIKPLNGFNLIRAKPSGNKRVHDSILSRQPAGVQKKFGRWTQSLRARRNPELGYQDTSSSSHESPMESRAKSGTRLGQAWCPQQLPERWFYKTWLLRGYNHTHAKQKLLMQKQNFTRNHEKLAKVPGANEETKSH